MFEIGANAKMVPFFVHRFFVLCELLDRFVAILFSSYGSMMSKRMGAQLAPLERK
jgi:hypothetical protein